MSDLEEQAVPSSDAGLSAEEKQWALFTHLAALTGLFTGGVGNIVGPLIIWLIKKDTLKFVDDQGKEALNFNITLLIVGVGLFLLTLVTFGLGIVITVPVGIVLGIAWFVLTIIATINASNGVAYRYPFTLRLIK